jgi:hypothetical protein
MERNDTWVYDVRVFGATGNGIDKDTAAIQAAIEHCTSMGGGRVLLPSGRYVSGTIYLKDNVELHLAAGAVLQGSPHRADYNAEDRFPESTVPDHWYKVNPLEKASSAHLVAAHRCHNVSITGPGTIDGHSSAFFQVEDHSLPYRYKIRPVKKGSWDWRPGEMVWFCRCQGVQVKDVSLINSPFWTVIMVGCEDVQVRGVRIVVPPTTWNGDGLNIDGCRNVVVSDCNIRSADDAIALKDSESLFPYNHFPDGTRIPDCENIVVTNCILSSPTRGILLGVGAEGRIRNCRFSNIIIRDTRTGIGIRARYGSDDHCLYGENGSGLLISDIHFANFTMDCITPFRIETGYPVADPAKADIHDISFTNFNIRSSQKAELIGQAQAPIRRARFRNIDWFVEKDLYMKKLVATGGVETSYMAALGQGCAFLVSHIEDCSFDNIHLYWQDPDPDMVVGFDVSNARDVDWKNMVLRQPAETGIAALRFRNSDAIRISGCRAAAGTTTFALLRDSPPNAVIQFRYNDFLQAVNAVDADVPVISIENIGIGNEEG